MQNRFQGLVAFFRRRYNPEGVPLCFLLNSEETQGPKSGDNATSESTHVVDEIGLFFFLSLE